MNNLETWKIIITIIIAVLGWIVTNYVDKRRDRALKKRELITTHLINAYRILANDITHREPSPERNLKLETVISELQLFGSKKQIMLTKKLTDDITKGGEFYLNDLLIGLRDELRKELDLAPIKEHVRWLRYDKPKT